MKLYNVYIRNSENGAIDGLVLVENGISYKALFFNVIWFMYYRMWKELFALFILIWSIFFLHEKHILPNHSAVTVTIISILIMVSINANYWRSKNLQKGGYKFYGCVFGKSREMAKLRFIEGYIENHPNDNDLFSEFILNPVKRKRQSLLFH